MGGLTAEQKKSYQENGFVLLDNIFTNEEMEEMSEAYDEVFDLKKKQSYNMEAAWTGEWRKEEKNKTVKNLNTLIFIRKKSKT